ncbi:MAG: hypothetical protein AB9919_02120 [Geobacteraceae bacterium]
MNIFCESDSEQTLADITAAYDAPATKQTLWTYLNNIDTSTFLLIIKTGTQWFLSGFGVVFIMFFFTLGPITLVTKDFSDLRETFPFALKWASLVGCFFAILGISFELAKIFKFHPAISLLVSILLCWNAPNIYYTFKEKIAHRGRKSLPKT